jgi:hypothetical protein
MRRPDWACSQLSGADKAHQRKAARNLYPLWHYSKALRESGLERTGPGYEVSPREMFLDWATVTRSLGMVPSMGDYGLKGRYSVRPFLRCYRGWRQVTLGMREYIQKEGLEGEWATCWT